MSTPLKEQLSKQLNSWTYFYAPFEGNGDDCKNGIAQNIENLKATNKDIENYLDNIKKAACYVDKMYNWENNLFGSVRCHFLYYWIGEKLSKSLTGHKFSGLLNIICSIVQQEYVSKGCRLICPGNIDQIIFNEMKAVYDFLYNYDTIYTRTRQRRTECNQQYTDYVQGISESHKKVEHHCTDKPNDDYCRNIWTKQKTAIQEKLSELQCKPPAAEEKVTECPSADQELQISSSTHPNNPPSTTTTALSSIFGTLATIGAPFLLYKYKLLAPWFGNNSNGKSRMKRSTARNPDTFTENSSTHDSTDTSTIGPTDIAENSTVRSGVYTTPSIRQSTRRTNNAPGRQNIGYQNM
ncbi:KIR protein [Plasmodium coatneyi]|uniref:KIR protein n=1 Tax=Plasmodium coatneyi TaxID=208452 RepID=A0A1B1DSU8_9APIC|nr:KIR protein [Plasmodium coatneyi]ANQ05868.1 KIR protein [Plasmodium coatneyi]